MSIQSQVIIKSFSFFSFQEQKMLSINSETIKILFLKLKDTLFEKVVDFLFEKVLKILKLLFCFLLVAIVFFILFHPSISSICNLNNTRKKVENYEQSTLEFHSLQIAEL